MYQVLGEDGRWKGDADTIHEARAFAEAIVLYDGEGEAGIEFDGEVLEAVGVNKHGEVVWTTSDLVRKHDGRS